MASHLLTIEPTLGDGFVELFAERTRVGNFAPESRQREKGELVDRLDSSGAFCVRLAEEADHVVQAGHGVRGSQGESQVEPLCRLVAVEIGEEFERGVRRGRVEQRRVLTKTNGNTEWGALSVESCTYESRKTQVGESHFLAHRYESAHFQCGVGQVEGDFVGFRLFSVHYF